MSDQKWPGYGQDGEDGRIRQERQREREIQAQNLSSRIRAADPAQRERIDPAIGRTFGDAQGRGMYSDARRLRDFREMNNRNRRTREQLRWRQVRERGRQGAN